MLNNPSNQRSPEGRKFKRPILQAFQTARTTSARIVTHPDAYHPGARRKRLWLWRLLGPGWVTGAADDDPSGIATYSQAGAGFGNQFLWLAALTFPLMAIVQDMNPDAWTRKKILRNLCLNMT